MFKALNLVFNIIFPVWTSYWDPSSFRANPACLIYRKQLEQSNTLCSLREENKKKKNHPPQNPTNLCQRYCSPPQISVLFLIFQDFWLIYLGILPTGILPTILGILPTEFFSATLLVAHWHVKALVNNSGLHVPSNIQTFDLQDLCRCWHFEKLHGHSTQSRVGISPLMISCGSRAITSSSLGWSPGRLH